MIGNKTAGKIKSVSKKSAKKLSNDKTKEEDVERASHKKNIHNSRRKTKNYWWIKVSIKKGCIFLEIIDELMLVLKKYTYLQKKENKLLIN